MIKTEELIKNIKEDETILHVFDVEDLYQEWHLRKQKSPTVFFTNAKTAAGFVSPIRDTATVIRICKDLGLFGQYVIKTEGKKQYVIFKGYAGLRGIFTAPRYLSTNKKVIKMAIGKAGVTSSIKIGGALTIVLFTGIEVLKCVFTESTLSQLAATLTTDLIKVGLGCIVAKAASLLVGGTATLAAGPLIVAIIAGVATNYLLEVIDEKYGYTKKLAEIMNIYGEAFAKKKEAMEISLGRKIHEGERELFYRLFHLDIDNPLSISR